MTITTSATRSLPAARPRFHRTLWAAQVVAALFFAAAASPKIVGTDQAVEAFDDIGAGQWLRVVVGVLEMAGAVGLLVPRLVGLAAGGLAVLMVGATVTNLFVVDDLAAAATTTVLLAVMAFVAHCRWSRIDIGPRRPTG